MYYQEIPKDVLEAFKVPHLYKLSAWFAVVCVLSVGVYLSCLNANWLWFARFGALIVIISLLIEASGLIQAYINRLVNLSADASAEIVRMQVVRQPYMYGLSGNESEAQIEQIAKKEHAQRITNLNLVIEKSLSVDIRRTEFSIGCVGTFVWGFGDLLSQFFG